jgi:hypothetical protein
MISPKFLKILRLLKKIQNFQKHLRIPAAFLKSAQTQYATLKYTK